MNGRIKILFAISVLILAAAITKNSFCKTTYTEDVKNNLNQIQTKISLKINSPVNFNNYSKAKIYETRKRYVAASLFASNKYEPNNQVFGAIEDNKPWYGLNYSGCINDAIGKTAAIEGPSEESRFINNPNVLIGINCGGVSAPISDPICRSKDFWLVPTNLSYDGKTKTISAIYKMPYKQTCQLTGINARDLGFNYVWANNVRNINFKNSPNISNQIYSFGDYIHKGGSCRINDGCNNCSPYQPRVEFEYSPTNTASISFKLWNKMPESKYKNADINYNILIYNQ